MGPGAGGARAPLRALRRRLQRVCAVEGGGRARADLAGALALAAAPAATESGEEPCRAPVVEEVSRLQRDVGSRGTAARGASGGATAEDARAPGHCARTGPTPRPHR